MKTYARLFHASLIGSCSVTTWHPSTIKYSTNV